MQWAYSTPKRADIIRKQRTIFPGFVICQILPCRNIFKKRIQRVKIILWGKSF